MRILSGIRPSGTLHLGNYIGAIQQWLGLQREHEVYYMVADLHAITTPYDPKTFQAQIRDVVADYLAAGLDPKHATIFVQSHVPEHTQLMWVLSSLTPTGELNRMTQYKDKLRGGALANAGLLTYPILMAADILAYRAECGPVGEDQVQHVELARDLAKRFNRMFGKTFPEPQPLLSQGKRIMSLKEPDKKMSKTNDDGIALTDAPAVIQRKIAKAVTATRGGGTSAGVENLFLMLRTFAEPNVVGRFERAERDGAIKYAELKTALAEAIVHHFAPFRKRRKEILADATALDRVLTDGARRARLIAGETLAAGYTTIGLR